VCWQLDYLNCLCKSGGVFRNGSQMSRQKFDEETLFFHREEGVTCASVYKIQDMYIVITSFNHYHLIKIIKKIILDLMTIKNFNLFFLVQ
jgi:hypothetical protein